ncbi:MAG: hypothetical protein IJ816_00945 [Alloprevotella sp.]|nr:hypothetical protein [Alloprevotella sp.]
MTSKYYTNGNPLRYLPKSWTAIAEQPKNCLSRLLLYIIIIGVAGAGFWYGFRQVFLDIIYPSLLLAEQGLDWHQSLRSFYTANSQTPIYVWAGSCIIGYFGLLMWKIRTTELTAPQDKRTNSGKRLIQLWLNDILVSLLIIIVSCILIGIHVLFVKFDNIPFWIEPTVLSLLGITSGFWILTLHIISQQHILVEELRAPTALWFALTRHADFQKWLLLGFIATICSISLGLALCLPALILCATDIIVIKEVYLSDQTIIPSYFPTALYTMIIVGHSIFFLVQTWILLAYSLCFKQSTRINYKDDNDTRTD